MWYLISVLLSYRRSLSSIVSSCTIVFLTVLFTTFLPASSVWCFVILNLPSCVLHSFQDHAEINSTILRSQTNTARVEGLRPGTVYVVQVRARTVAGFGKYSSKMCFQTLTDGKDRQARRNSSLSLLLSISILCLAFPLTHTHTHTLTLSNTLVSLCICCCIIISRWDRGEP